MATTPNYSFSVYSSTDTDVRFLDFRVATAGSQSTSNFYVIDTVLKQHSDAIDSINATPSAFVVKGTYSSGSLYTASVANYPGYKNEQLIVLSLNQKNTGAVQININGTTNKDVMKYGSNGVLKAVDAGDFVANSPVLCLYDGTRFVVIGITSASSITVTGEAGDILQIADDGTIESSGKKAAQPNGIATLDADGKLVQTAKLSDNATTAAKTSQALTIQLNGTAQPTFNGSTARTINVTPASIGAATTGALDGVVSDLTDGTTKVGYATKADTDNLGNQITETYANSLDVADNTIVLKNKIGENLSTITVPYANSAGNVATSIKEMGIAVQTASPYAWFLNYTGSGNKDDARKYYASVYADNATYSTSAGSSNNIVIYNNNWSGTDGSISAIYANAEKTYVDLASSNAAGTAWPNISVQRINGHLLNMALNGTSLSITW